jgi:hypothetical protein
MKVADLTYLLVPRLCLVTHIRRLCLQSFPATNEAEPRLHGFPGRALEPVNFIRKSTRSQALPGNAYQEALPRLWLGKIGGRASLTWVPRQSLGTS